MEEVQRHWRWLDQNLLPYMAVFENKEDAASFVLGKVKARLPTHSHRHNIQFRL